MNSGILWLGATSCTLGLATAVMAGGSERFEVSFSGVDVFPGDITGNVQNLDTAGQGGRYYGSFGYSNLDFDVCYNPGGSFPNWASEIQFVMEMEDGSSAGAGALFLLAPSPFAGDDTGADVEGTCSNRAAADEIDNAFPAFTYQVPDDGLVDIGISASFDDGTGLRHSVCNTANYYFTLGADIPPGCASGTGSCSEPNGTPACDDLSCCANVCDTNQGGDPFCCDSSWDSSCVDLALTLCNIFVYSCDAPSYANDCATSPISLANGDTVAFDTTLANQDGPAFTCANGGGPSVWYLVANESAVAQQLTVSTCNAATYDTAIALYDAGAIGGTIDPAVVFANTEFACNDDGGGCADFSSLLVATMDPGVQYLIAVGGYEGAAGTGSLTVSWSEPEPPIDPYTCDAPGPDSFSQTAANAVLQNNALACAGGGITTAQKYARVYTAADMGSDRFTIDCVEFGVANSGSYLEGAINLYTTVNSGPAPSSDLVLVASAPYGFYPTTEDAEFSLVSFDGGAEIDLSGGESLVIELETDASLDGFAAPAGGVTADVTSGETWGFALDCGDVDYVTYGSFGSDFEWFVNVQGTAGEGGTPCPADFDGNGIVDGGDFGQILISWGPCPAPCAADLDGDGQVGGSDVGQILISWGPCAP